MSSHDFDATPLDAEGWTALIESYDHAVLLVVIESWMSAALRREHGAEDILQEALGLAWRDRAQHEWHGRRAFRAWLLQIAKNRIRDAADRQNAHKRGGGAQPAEFSVIAPSQGSSISGILPSISETPSRAASARDRAAAIAEALAALEDEGRDLIRLRFLEQLPMREVAERLGITRTTANRRLVKGLRQYQRELERRLGASAWRT
ncbi:MAG: sigma-70 family RNA polymerase sigma factor [Planctomycetes bacterium]|nr:sigma-70 family RNA polymerase sigma factor [Planctomycetota bacterium]